MSGPRWTEGLKPEAGSVKGYRKLPNVSEVWYDPEADALVVLGRPENDAPFEDGGHDCDHMGCGSVGGHVLYRAKVVWS